MENYNSVEFAHEISQLPRPPDILQDDINTNWQFDTDNIFSKTQNGGLLPLYYLSALSEYELMELSQFESKFKQLMYEGVSVNRVVMGAVGRGNETLERRTLWLMLPEIGSLRIGFLSKFTDEAEVDSDNDDEVESKFSNHERQTKDAGPSSNNDDATACSVNVSWRFITLFCVVCFIVHVLTVSTFDPLQRSTYVEGNLAKRFTIDLSDIISVERYATVSQILITF